MLTVNNATFCHPLKRVNGGWPTKLRGVLTILGLTILTACAGGKAKDSVDNSAEYQSAVTRPPLKKTELRTPSNVATASSNESEALTTTALENDTSVETAVGSNILIDSDDLTSDIEESVTKNLEPGLSNTDAAFIPERVETAGGLSPDDGSLSREKGSLPRADGSLSDVSVGEGDITSDTVAEAEDVSEQSGNAVVSSLALKAQVISPKKDVSRLQVEADFADAWLYLTRNLKGSDVTVFNRNKAAGRFAIGCSGIEAAATVAKKGSWSFFNKRQKKQQEYCSLQAAATRGVTMVTVLNRFNEEVDGKSANDIFSRILNN